MHLLCLVISTLAITASAVAQQPSTVLLNQDLLEHWWEGTERQDMTLDSSLSSEGQALRAASTTLTQTVDFNEPRSVLRLILETTGAQATVYPTERYFYYKFDLGHRRISGNLRFTEIEDGFLHMGYFDDFMPRGAIQIGTFIDGQDISIEDGPLPNQYIVSFEDLRTFFTLNTQPFDRADELSILEGENYISGILDESGHTLHLLYNTIDHMFFYVRSVSADQPESFTNYTTPLW